MVFHLRLGARIGPVRIVEWSPFGDRQDSNRLRVRRGGADEDVPAAVPGERGNVPANGIGRKEPELADDVELLGGEARVRGIVGDIARDETTIGRQSRVVIAAIEDADLVAEAHAFVHTREADLARAANIENSHVAVDSGEETCIMRGAADSTARSVSCFSCRRSSIIGQRPRIRPAGGRLRIDGSIDNAMISLALDARAVVCVPRRLS